MAGLRRLKKLSIIFFVLLFAILIMAGMTLAIVYTQQDQIIKEVVERLNHDFKGRLEIRDSHISPFENFPYISIDFEDVEVYETKGSDSEQLLKISDVYVGFDFWTVVDGSYEAKRISLKDGFVKLVQHTDGTFNLMNVFLSEEEATENDQSGSFHFDLKTVRLQNIDLIKLNESNNIMVEAFINDAYSSFKTSKNNIQATMDTQFLFNLVIENDTSFLHDKQVELITAINFNQETNKLSIDPSEVFIGNALFLMEGTVDVSNDMDLDLSFKGNKPNFDLFLAFAPEEIEPVLNRYDNGGRIYFDAAVKGKSINGHNPKVDVDFGCEEAFIYNAQEGKRVNDLFFEGHFTNGDKRDISTMSLSLTDFSARPETGNFSGNLEVSNFESPEIDLQLISQFDLDFLAGFLNITDLKDVSGFLSLEMNFHDIIDLSQPEKSIEKLNESYFTKLDVRNLNFSREGLPASVKDINILVTMDGHEAEIEQLEFKLGESDISITASVSDLPAIMHHTDIPVKSTLSIKSDLIDLKELTFNDSTGTSASEDQIKNLSTQFSFVSSAKAFTESPNLPIGEFFVDNLNASFKNYPHRIHDFHADIIIDSSNFRIIDFTGMIDDSDFHFNGKLENYDLWFEETPVGNTIIDFNLDSDLIQLEDLFSYNGENHVPEEYRHEELSNLNLHGVASLDFNGDLQKTEVTLDKLETNLKVHPIRFEKFRGNILLDKDHIDVKNFRGRLGRSEFTADLTYYFSQEGENAKPNEFVLDSDKLDFDQLFLYNPPPPGTNMTPEDHEAGFNIFEVPFSNTNFSIKIENLNYHRYILDDFKVRGRMQKDHYVYLDTMYFKASGGSFGLNGYFNGSDPKNIYFSPNLRLHRVNLDKFLFKFENFGQDQLVSDNLHGELSGNLTGNIHMHADMVPIIDDSEIHIDFEVINGSLNDFAVFDALADYFTDKNLDQVRFDTLKNTLDVKNSTLYIPKMNINSSLGYFEISGEQNLDTEMDYFVRIPLKVVTRAGMQKLFSKKDQDNSEQVDEIQYRDESKKTRFLNLRIEGTPENYRISMQKDKKKEGADD